MADVEKIEINGVSYDVADATARSTSADKDLSNLSETGEKRLTDISDAVSTERNTRIQEDGRLSQRIEEVNSNIGNGTLTIKKDGVQVGTFSANQKGNTEIDLTHAPQKQADWNQENQQEVDFIKNKPTALSAFTNDLEFTPETLQGTTANFVPGQTYSYEEALQRVANLFDGWDTAYVQRFSSYVPGDTTPENHLMNKNQTDYAIQTNASNFRGNFANWSSVPADASGYLPDASGSTTPTNHDYIVVEDMSDFPVLDPSQSMRGRWRVTYNGDWSELGVAGWYPEYSLDVTFTQAQQAAIDSGATSAKITQYDGYDARITSVETDKVDKDYTSGKKLYGKSATLGQVMYRPGDHIELTDDGIIKVVGVTEQLTGDIPVASDSNLGQIFQYTGPTNDTFENGLFYRAEKVTPTDYTVVTSDPDTMIDISIDGDTFSKHYVSGKTTYIYTYQKPGLWFGQWYDEDGNQVFPRDLGISWRESMSEIQDGTIITVTAGQEKAAWREVVVSTMKSVLRQYDDSTLPNPADVVGLPFQFIGKNRLDMWYGGFFESKPFGEGSYYIKDFSPSLGGISMDPMLFLDFVWNELGSSLAEISFVYQDGLLSGWVCEQAPMMWRQDLSEIGITVDNEPQPGNQIIISNDNITYQFTNMSVSDIYTNDNRVDIQYDANGIPVINLNNVPEQVDYMEWPYQELDGKVVQFIGNDYDQYVCGYFYRCEQDMDNNWVWRQLDVQPSSSVNIRGGTGISVTGLTSKTISADTTYFNNNYNKKLNSTTFTLLASNWSGDVYTATIYGISATSIVWVSPDALSAPAYANAQILCTGQGENSLTFSKIGEVTDDITVNIVIG